MHLYAQNIMNRNLITVSPQMLIEEAMEIFWKHRISGAPVVDARGVLVGVISLYDIVKSSFVSPNNNYYFEEAHLERLLAQEGLHLEAVSGGFVSDYMSCNVYTAYPQTPVEELARQMLKNSIHRLIIVKPNEQVPVGIVTTCDLLKLIAVADTLESGMDECASWYEKKFSQIRYDTLPTLQ